MMGDSIQLGILKLLTTHIEGVTPANDYDFDLTGAVFRSRLLYGDDVPETMVSIVEHLQGDITTDVAGEENIESVQTWILLVQGIAKNEIANPLDNLYNLKASVEHRLARLILRDTKGNPTYPNEFWLGIRSWKVITGFTIGPGIVSPPREGISSKAFFYMPIGVGLALNISEPFVPVVP